jgi:hypothetical protein
MNKFEVHKNSQFIIIVYKVETRHPISIILTNLFKHVLKVPFIVFISNSIGIIVSIYNALNIIPIKQNSSLCSELP